MHVGADGRHRSADRQSECARRNCTSKPKPESYPVLSVQPYPGYRMRWDETQDLSKKAPVYLRWSLGFPIRKCLLLVVSVLGFRVLDLGFRV